MSTQAQGTKAERKGSGGGRKRCECTGRLRSTPGTNLLVVATLVATLLLSTAGALVQPASIAAQETILLPGPTPSGTGPEVGAQPIVTFQPAIGGFAFQSGEVTERGPSHVTYAPDASTLAVGTRSSIFLYNALTLRLVRLIMTEVPIVSQSYSPDSELIASGSFTNTVKLFSAKTGQLVRSLSAPQGAVNGIAFSPDGKVIATASSDGAVRLWQVSTGEVLRVLYGHLGAVWTVEFSPSGELLASGGADGTVRIWRVRDGMNVSVLEGVVGGVSSLSFRPDGGAVALGSGDGLVRLWDTGTATISEPLTGHLGGVTDVAFSPDGAYLVTSAYDGKVFVWDVEDGTVIHTMPGPESAVVSLAIAPHTAILATGALSGDVQLWRFPPAPVPEPGPVPPACTNDAAFITDVTIPDNTVLPAGGLFYKTWRTQNSGTCPWAEGYRLEYLSGGVPAAANSQPVPYTAAGGTADVSVPMYAPSAPGTHRSVWQLTAPDGQRFGPRLTVVIQVPAPPTPTPTATPQPVVQIWSDRTTINAGEMVTIYARVQYVQAAWLDDQPIVNNYAQKTVQLCEPQTFTVDALATSGERVSRSVKVNVQGSCVQPRARLRIKELWADNTDPQVGEVVRLSIRVRNEGDRDARGFDLLWRPSDSARYQVVGSGLDLDVDDTTTLSWDHTYGSPGTLESKAKINFDGHETHRELTFTVHPPPAPTTGNPNLDLSSLSSNTTEPEVGQTVRFTAEITNRGDGPAYDTRLLWRPSRDAQFLLIEGNLSIAAGHQAKVDFEYTFAAPGAYETQAVVALGSRDLSLEMQDATNSAALRIEVVPVPVPPTDTSVPIPPTATVAPPSATPAPEQPTESPIPPPTGTPALPTDTPVPPTSTSVPQQPTDTAIAPTETPVPPTDTAVVPMPDETPITEAPTEALIPVPATSEPATTEPPEEVTTPEAEPEPLIQLEPQPDLVLGDFFTSRSRAAVGQPITFEVDIRNRGDVQADGFRLLGRPGPDTPLVVIADQLSLGPDAELPLQFQYVFETPGAYEPEVLVTFLDPSSAEQEAQPQERRTFPITVVEPPLPLGEPDPAHLRVVLKANNRFPAPEEPVQFLARLENKGLSHAFNFALAFRSSEELPYQVIAEGLNLESGDTMDFAWEFVYPVSGVFKAAIEVQNVSSPNSDYARINVQ